MTEKFYYDSRVEVKHTFRAYGKPGGWDWKWWPGIVIKVMPKYLLVSRIDIYGNKGLLKAKRYKKTNVRLAS